MPELPEVETIRRDLERGVLHKTIQAIEIIDSRVLRQPAKEFASRLKGQKFTSVERRGKALVLALSSGEYLIVQVMMTGQMVYNGRPDTHTRLMFDLGEDTLLYNDQRVFGQLRVVKSVDEVKYFRILGPEPFAPQFNAQYIRGALKKSKRPIKNFLMDHTFVAGIGNIYACEVLFRCRLSPKRRSDRITAQAVPLLYDQTLAVLNEAIDSRGSSMRNYRDGAGEKGRFNERIKVYARAGKPCIVCAGPIKRIVQAGRSTFYCPNCQR